MNLVTKLSLFVFLTVHCLSDQNTAQNNQTIQAHKDHRAREREKRKNEIRDFISRSFNWVGQPMPTGEQVRERISELPEVKFPLTTTIAPNPLAMHYTERVQSFFPTCNYPDSLLTQLPDIPNISPQFYKVKFPPRRPDTQISVNAAKLRLYKLGSDGPSQTDKKIRITVSQLKLETHGRRSRPRTNKVVMLDSKMVEAAEPGWISLDVTGAVKRWHSHTHRPMALMLQVEDDKKKSLLPNSYLQPLSCDADPSPGLQLDSLTSHPAPLINGENLLASLNKNNQPLIDISTVETPGGQDIPQSVMIWGLPHKTSLDNENAPYNGAVQDVEIRHIPSPATSEPEQPQDDDDDNLTPTEPSSDNNSSGELQTLEEVDYLAPLFGYNDQTRNRNKNNYGYGPQPIATRIILSRDQMLEEMKKLDKVQDEVSEVKEDEDNLEKKVDSLYDRQKTETEFYKKLFMSLMTTAEQKKVFGDV